MTFKKGQKGYWTGKKRPGMKNVPGWNRTGKSPWNKGKKSNLSGEKHPLWTGKNSKEHICEFCNKTFTTKRYNKQRFCSSKCKNNWMSKSGFVKGKNNGMWENGSSKKRHPWIFKNKISPMLRKSYPCIICGTKENLVVHHIDLNKQNNCLDNLVVLCRKHHRKIHNEINKFNKMFKNG